WPAHPLRSREGKAPNQPGSRLTRLDHVVDIPARRSLVGTREKLLVIPDQLITPGSRIVSFLEFLAKNETDRGRWPHYGDFGRRPGDVEIRAGVFRAHHDIGTAIGFPCDHGQLWHRRLTEG